MSTREAKPSQANILMHDASTTAKSTKTNRVSERGIPQQVKPKKVYLK